jgi:hypothetical protein
LERLNELKIADLNESQFVYEFIQRFCAWASTDLKVGSLFQ